MSKQKEFRAVSEFPSGYSPCYFERIGAARDFVLARSKFEDSGQLPITHPHLEVRGDTGWERVEVVDLPQVPDSNEGLGGQYGD